MTELVFILTDFSALTAGAEKRAQLAAATLPRLPALETVLARAQRTALAYGWREWLAARMGAASMTPAATVAAAWLGAEAAGGPGAARHYWLATPVHFFAGIDRIQLHPAGLLSLPDAQQRDLVTQFAQVFGDSPWRLTALGARELLLAGPPLQASGIDPAGFAGEDPSAGLPQGPDAAALKRLGSEIELWLHEHPLNRARAVRGELAVSTLWLWGGARDIQYRQHQQRELRSGAAPTAPEPPAARLFGRDTYAEALWRLRGAAAWPLPQSLTEAAELIDGPADGIFLYPMRHDGSVPAALAQLEHCWLAAAGAALRRRRIAAVQLLIGARAYQLSWLDLGRLWRARAPWWEELMWGST
ncbi:MAG: hypothetical protein ACREU2_18420 [Steroidobacteraceae bacterium]